MRVLATLAALVLGLTAAATAPAVAEFRLDARAGSVRVTIGDARVKAGRGFHRRDRHHRRKIRRRGRHGMYPLPVYPYHYYDRSDGYLRRSERDRPPERVETPPEPVPPVAVIPDEPPPPPDPRGPLRLTPARGAVPDAVPYRVGEALPAGLPHVTLDWRQYALPEPPAGRLYARVGRTVLLITAAGRVVERVVPHG